MLAEKLLLEWYLKFCDRREDAGGCRVLAQSGASGRTLGWTY
jgi:hypothetical protein